MTSRCQSGLSALQNCFVRRLPSDAWYLMASHILSLTLAEQNWRQNSTFMLYAVFQDRMWAVELYMFWLQQLYQTIGPRTLLRQLNCSSWSCHPTLMPFWLQSACTLVLTLVSSTLSVEVCRSRVLKSVNVAHSKQTCIVGRAVT